ncbi:MAG: hypothetical protein IPP83_00005 [Flavobacteriales bacterium]|nr:hypothetical protein [Flavobacteriales bacterium]
MKRRRTLGDAVHLSAISSEGTRSSYFPRLQALLTRLVHARWSHVFTDLELGLLNNAVYTATAACGARRQVQGTTARVAVQLIDMETGHVVVTGFANDRPVIVAGE